MTLEFLNAYKIEKRTSNLKQTYERSCCVEIQASARLQS
jgi:hypothetical protein